MRTLIVTAADKNFFPLLQGLLPSLHQWRERPFTDIAILDLGLSRDQRAWAAQAARYIVEPNWDLPVDEAVRAKQNPQHRSCTARPFLPGYFPGYDIYLWLDADTWVQQRFALDMLITAAARGPLAIVREIHPAYEHTRETVDWRTGRIRSYFGEEAVRGGRWDAYVNSGVFALRGDAPHWSLWAEKLHLGLENSRFVYFSDQTALNYAIWTTDLPVTYLPARCNWLCHLTLPRYDQARSLFCEPGEEHNAIGIIHMAGDTKNASLDGITMSKPRSLRYPFPSPIENRAASHHPSPYKGIAF